MKVTHPLTILAVLTGSIQSVPDVHAAGVPVVGVPDIDPIEAELTAYDGDGFYLSNGLKVRLWGIDAAELGTDEGEPAFQALARFNGSRATCFPPPDKTRYPVNGDRIVARCFTGAIAIDIARHLVTNGFARGWPKFSAGFYATE